MLNILFKFVLELVFPACSYKDKIGLIELAVALLTLTLVLIIILGLTEPLSLDVALRHVKLAT